MWCDRKVVNNFKFEDRVLYALSLGNIDITYTINIVHAHTSIQPIERWQKSRHSNEGRKDGSKNFHGTGFCRHHDRLHYLLLQDMAHRERRACKRTPWLLCAGRSFVWVEQLVWVRVCELEWLWCGKLMIWSHPFAFQLFSHVGKIGVWLRDVVLRGGGEASGGWQILALCSRSGRYL